MSIHKHLTPRKRNFKIKIRENKTDKPMHIVYGLWAGVALIALLPGKRDKEISEGDILNIYGVLMRTLGFF